MVAVESEDRSIVDLHVLNDGVVHHQAGYGGDFLWAPELVESEM